MVGLGLAVPPQIAKGSNATFASDGFLASSVQGCLCFGHVRLQELFVQQVVQVEKDIRKQVSAWNLQGFRFLCKVREKVGMVQEGF